MVILKIKFYYKLYWQFVISPSCTWSFSYFCWCFVFSFQLERWGTISGHFIQLPQRKKHSLRLKPSKLRTLIQRHLKTDKHHRAPQPSAFITRFRKSLQSTTRTMLHNMQRVLHWRYTSSGDASP
jgi:hypothetical protein